MRTKHHEVRLACPGRQSTLSQGHIGATKLGIDLHCQVGCVLLPAPQLAGIANASFGADKALARSPNEAVSSPLHFLSASLMVRPAYSHVHGQACSTAGAGNTYSHGKNHKSTASLPGDIGHLMSLVKMRQQASILVHWPTMGFCLRMI